MLLQHCAQVFLGFSTPAFLSFFLFSSPKCKEALFILDKGIVTCMASLERACRSVKHVSERGRNIQLNLLITDTKERAKCAPYRVLLSVFKEVGMA